MVANSYINNCYNKVANQILSVLDTKRYQCSCKIGAINTAWCCTFCPTGNLTTEYMIITDLPFVMTGASNAWADVWTIWSYCYRSSCYLFCESSRWHISTACTSCWNAGSESYVTLPENATDVCITVCQGSLRGVSGTVAQEGAGRVTLVEI